MNASISRSPDGAIGRLDSGRSDLLAFEIRSKISKPDIEWMSHIVDTAFDAHNEVDMLLIMQDYEGSDLSARFSADAAAVQIRSLGHVRRYAVVGAPGWASAMIKLSGKMTPVETKTFELAGEAAAWEWVDAGREERP